MANTSSSAIRFPPNILSSDLRSASLQADRSISTGSDCLRRRMSSAVSLPVTAGAAKHADLGGREQGITGIDRLGVPPDVPDSGPMPAVRAAILDVVVDEREVVEELDRRGQWGGIMEGAARGRTGQHGDERSHALAPNADLLIGGCRFASRCAEPKMIASDSIKQRGAPRQLADQTLDFLVDTGKRFLLQRGVFIELRCRRVGPGHLCPTFRRRHVLKNKTHSRSKDTVKRDTPGEESALPLVQEPCVS